MTQPSQPSNNQTNERTYSHTDELVNQAAEISNSSAEPYVTAQHSNSNSNAVEPHYPTNREAMNISLYGNHADVEDHSSSSEAEVHHSSSSDLEADGVNEWQADASNNSPTSANDPTAKTKPIHSELLRYDHADDIYE